MQVVQDPRFLAMEARLSRPGFRELVEERFIHLPIMLWSATQDTHLRQTVLRTVFAQFNQWPSKHWLPGPHGSQPKAAHRRQ